MIHSEHVVINVAETTLLPLPCDIGQAVLLLITLPQKKMVIK
jgi:hypothetical protein